MRRMRKLVGLVLAMVMVLAMSLTALAAENKIVIKGTDGHFYEAYQIFTGTLSEDGTTLSDIVWGSGITAEGQADMKAADAYAKTISDADAFAKLLVDNKYLQNPISPDEAGATYTFGNLKAGYYLVKDQAGSLAGKEDQAYTSYIVQVVGTVTMNPKSDIPTVEKKVKDINDSNTTDFTGWQDSADHDMGDAVPFRLTGTLPDNYGDYTVYTYVFHDTLSAGLTYNGDGKVYVVNGETSTDVTAAFEIKYEGTALTVSCADLKAIAGVAIDANSKIVVEYTATLNENAVIGSAGNPNTVYLEYSNNPNYDGKGDVEKNETGNTPEDKVIVFTYKVVVNKIDKDKEPLAGAGFTLYKKESAGNYVAVGEELTGDALTTFEWVGLDDGDYKLSETTTPDGYNTADDIEFTIIAAHDLTSEDPKLTQLVGGAKFTGEVSTGTLTTAVVNEAGTVLPSTGGMGTTVFYIIGAVLMIGAAVLLITKKRMN